MIRISAWARMLGLTMGILMVGTAAASSDCAALLDEFDQALQQRNLDEMLRLEQEIAVDAVCGRHLADVQRRRAALQLRIAAEMMEAGRPEADYEPLIVAAAQPEVLWHAANALGDIRFSQRRYVEAALAYDRALQIINNPAQTPTAPDSAMIKSIAERVTYARQLAASEPGEGGELNFVPAARNRDGTVGGIFAPNLRGFTPTSVPLPITFYTAETTFTEVGEAAAREFLTALREQQPDTVTIVGHADERGPHEYNMELSANRAEAVKQYLRRHGIDTRIVTDGRGWTEPLELPDDLGLTQEEIWALNRRVEWVRE